MKNPIIKFRCSIVALIMIVLNGAGAYASAPWTVNPGDYRYDMSLYLDVSFKTDKMDYSQYVVAAFVGDECRGVAEVLSLPDDSQCLYLRARSNQETGETMTFKYYNVETEETLPIERVTFDFKSNGRLGYPSTPHKVTIIYYYDVNLTAGQGGTLDHESDRLAEGTELTITATPAEGYHFEKWADESTDNPRTITVDGDITLTAQFAVNSYKMTYMVDETMYKETTVPYGTAITPEAEPVKEGYTFSGWDNVPQNMPARDITVKGTFTINSYMLSVYLNGELIHSETLEFGSPVSIAEPEVPEGMKFDGWKETVPETMPAHDVDIHGTYSLIDAISSVSIDENASVVVCNLNGQVIYSNARWQDVRKKLAKGIYIINGRKQMILK